jgi:hypothetical protein
VRQLLWLFVLMVPGLAFSQAGQCTLYQAGAYGVSFGPGPMETSVAAAESDTNTILQAYANASTGGPNGAVDGYTFDGCVPNSGNSSVPFICNATWAFHNDWEKSPKSTRQLAVNAYTNQS